jgi:hypothetical protein
MALTTFAFFGFSLPKENFINDETLLTQKFWFSLINKFIDETTDSGHKKYAIMAKDYIVYEKYCNDYNPVTEKTFVFYQFMSERHVEQFKTLINPILIWANEKYGVVLADEHIITLPDLQEDVLIYATYIMEEGCRVHIPQQLGYIS